MRELVVATRNKGKIEELQLLLEGVVEKVLPISDFGGAPEVVENGATFEENAIKKARSAAEYTGKPAIADDSGLVVEALNGLPGVHSARFAGDDATDDENNKLLLERLGKLCSPVREAAFRCTIAYCEPGQECRTFTGEIKGLILDTPRGEGGFGYDPLFMVPEYGKTLAELSISIKNRISHRGEAFRKLAADLRERQSK